MRVLSLALLLGCAAGGAALARWVPGRTNLAGVMIGLGLLATDASLRAWTIPGNPYALSPAEWPAAGNQINRDFDRDDRPFIAAVARVVTGRVLSDAAGLREFFQRGEDLFAALDAGDRHGFFPRRSSRRPPRGCGRSGFPTCC